MVALVPIMHICGSACEMSKDYSGMICLACAPKDSEGEPIPETFDDNFYYAMPVEGNVVKWVERQMGRPIGGEYE